MPAPPGSAGYADAAPGLLATRIAFAHVHAPLIPLLPAAPSAVLDIGAGPGHDAAALAGRGHDVTAVEPVAALREGARRLYGALIDWCDDSLPDLPRVRAAGRTFDLILISGVWHHLDLSERCAAIARVAALLRERGLLAITLRHGAPPPGRRVFAVSPAETIALAKAQALELLAATGHDSIQPANRAAGVTWTYLIFRR